MRDRWSGPQLRHQVVFRSHDNATILGIVGIAWHRDRYRIPAAGAFIRLTQRAAEREQEAARLLDG